MLKLENVSIEYSKTLFENVNFILGNNEKVGLVGLNGTGKTTLLKIIAGVETPESGSVHLVGEALQYLPQVFDITEKGKFEFIGEYLESLVEDIYSNMWKVNKILSKLDFGEFDEFDELKTLSPGQKMKLYLVKLLISQPTILLLDEPTNHLDIVGIEWFETFIKSFEGICIVISHDRSFLNSVTTNIFEIDEQKLKVYEGNYDDFLIQKQKDLEERKKQIHLQQKKKIQFEKAIERTRKMAPGEKQGRALQALRSRMEREVLQKEIEDYKQLKVKKIEIEGKVHSQKSILEVKNLNFSYRENQKLLKNINLEIFGPEVIWLKGQNGTGKSTFIKLLIEELKTDSGTIKWGAAVKWAYFSQQNADWSINKTVQQYFFESTNVFWEKSFGVLNSFLFDNDLRNKKIYNLSPGQKARLKFAVFAQNEYDCLILDEPTNHLDIETKEVIEHALNDYTGAIILVSHDRYFANQLNPNRILSIIDGGLKVL